MADNRESTPLHAASSERRRARFGICVQIANLGAIGILTGVSIFLFLQLQVVTYKVASEQKQIDTLMDKIQNKQQQQIEDLSDKVEHEHSLTIYHMAGTFTLLTCLITMFHMSAHLRNFNQPSVQRKILAILWMSPIYGVTSFLSLVFPVLEGYLSIVKDFYEAYVIYQFLAFLIAVLGRDGDRNSVVEVLSRHANHLRPPYKCLSCFYHPDPQESDKAMANAVLLECQILAMQFVLFRPLTSIINFVLNTIDEYQSDGKKDDDDDATTTAESGWDYLTSPQFAVTMIMNVSVFFAFAGLLKFYHAVREDLLWCKPFPKFLCIKGIVFMTFWQGLAISIVLSLHHGRWGEDNDGSSKDPKQAAATIQNLLICLEMVLFSIAHWCVFPVEEWEEGYRPREYAKPGMGFKDFVSDVSIIIDSSKASRAGRQKQKNGLGPIPTDDVEEGGLVVDDNDFNEQ